MSTLGERVVEAQRHIAMNAIASPHVWPQHARLRAAKVNLELAQQELVAAQKAWDDLIEPAPAAWKKLAPQV